MRAINILSIFATLCIFCKSFALSDIGVDPLEEDLYGGGGFDGYDEYRDDYQGKRPDITELHSSDEIDEFLKVPRIYLIHLSLLMILHFRATNLHLKLLDTLMLIPQKMN